MDSGELHQLAQMLMVSHLRMEGLEKLAAALAKVPARKLLCEQQTGIIPDGQGQATLLQAVFRGLRTCLQVNESQSDALLRVN